MDSKATVLATIQDCLVAIQPCPDRDWLQRRHGGHAGDGPGAAVDGPATGQPIPGPPVPSGKLVPVPVWEDFFWRRISPKAILLPVTLKDTRYDEAPWIGYQWRKPSSSVKQQYKLPEEWTGGNDSALDKPYFEPLMDPGRRRADVPA